MRYRNEENLSKIILGESYKKNCEQLLNNIDNNKMNFQNNIPVFKYKKLLLKYDHMPSQEEIREEIRIFLYKVNRNDNFRIFNIKSGVNQNSEGIKEYIINIAFINSNLK